MFFPMTWGSKIYLWMTRFNTIALTLIILFFIGLFLQDRYRMWSYSHENRLNDGTTNENYGAAAKPAAPMTGQEIRTPGGDLVSYYLAENADSFEWDKGQNITVVNLSNGKSHKVLVDNDPRAIINWELIEKNGENPVVYVGYVAWAATKEQYDQGRADLLFSAFPDINQHTLGKNVKYAYLPKVKGTDSIALIMWPEEDQANFVSFDMKSGQIIDKKEIDLPKMKRNFLSMNHGLPGQKFARLHRRTLDAPINEFSHDKFGFIE